MRCCRCGDIEATGRRRVNIIRRYIELMLGRILLLVGMALLALSVDSSAEQPQIELEYVTTVDIQAHGYGIDVTNNHIFAVAGHPGTLYAINMIEPVNASVIDIFPDFADAKRIIVSEDRAYVEALSALLIFDISNPNNISLLGVHNPIGGGLYLQAVKDQYVLYTQSRLNGFAILDTRDPTNISTISFYDSIPNPKNEGGAYTRSIIIDNNYAILIEKNRRYSENHIWLFDISNPYLIKNEGNISIQNNYNPGGLSCNCLIVGSDVLKAIDISNPKIPNVLGESDFGSAYIMAVNNYYAFISTKGGDDGIKVVDIMDSSNMYEVFSLNNNYHVLTGIELINDHLIVSQRNNSNDSTHIYIYKIKDRRPSPDFTFLNNEIQLAQMAIGKHETLLVNATVVNRSPGPTPFAEAILTLDGNTVAARFKVPPLKANETWIISHELVGFQSGKHILNLSVHLECNYSELRIDNNQISATFTVVGFPHSTPSFSLSWTQLVFISLISTLLSRQGNHKCQ